MKDGAAPCGLILDLSPNSLTGNNCPDHRVSSNKQVCSEISINPE
jgi:hypothetical protein